MPAAKAVTVTDFQTARGRRAKLTVLTAYDFMTARLVDESGVDAILVGDSLGMTVQGHPTSLPVTLDEMIYHTKCVVRGTKRAMVIVDLPFMSYQLGPKQALKSAGRILQESGAHAVKLEGGARSARSIRAITEAGIPVMGHVGMTPQSVHAFGGFRVQRNQNPIVEDAIAVEAAGAFAVVVECVPTAIGTAVTTAIGIPTIGIGAGPHCDGQVLVIQDLLGLYDDFRPKFVKRYAELGTQIRTAVASYCTEVRNGTFPAREQSFD
jgi:3-methyl-2-oxobutanoate hydroxymethyltransferase